MRKTFNGGTWTVSEDAILDLLKTSAAQKNLDAAAALAEYHDVRRTAPRATPPATPRRVKTANLAGGNPRR